MGHQNHRMLPYPLLSGGSMLLDGRILIIRGDRPLQLAPQLSIAFNSAHCFGSQINAMSNGAARLWLLAARWPGASSNSSAMGRPGYASRTRRRKAWKCACSRLGRRKRSRCPVRRLIVPNKTRFALHPVIATCACSPWRAHARRKTGSNSRRSLNSSIHQDIPFGFS